MNKLASILPIFILILLLSACGSPTQPPTPTVDLVSTLVAATLTAFVPPSPTLAPASETPATPPTATPTTPPPASPTPQPSPTSSTASVGGEICYRTNQIPAMNAYFQEKEAEQALSLPVAAGQTDYEVQLPPGTYIAYAWLPDFSLGGLYSKAVPCGLKADCTDHTPLEFTVKAGEIVDGIDICDWYAFAVPLPPDKEPEDVRGGISGQINYPGGNAPTLHVVAFNQGSGYWYYTNTLQGASSYTLNRLPPGDYLVVAYTQDGKAGGHALADHSLILVTIKAGQILSGIDITDWSAPQGTFPPDPTQW